MRATPPHREDSRGQKKAVRFCNATQSNESAKQIHSSKHRQGDARDSRPNVASEPAGIAPASVPTARRSGESAGAAELSPTRSAPLINAFTVDLTDDRALDAIVELLHLLSQPPLGPQCTGQFPAASASISRRV